VKRAILAALLGFWLSTVTTAAHAQPEPPAWVPIPPGGQCSSDAVQWGCYGSYNGQPWVTGGSHSDPTSFQGYYGESAIQGRVHEDGVSAVVLIRDRAYRVYPDGRWERVR
jgi:hypothetical protein